MTNEQKTELKAFIAENITDQPLEAELIVLAVQDYVKYMNDEFLQEEVDSKGWQSIINDAEQDGKASEYMF